MLRCRLLLALVLVVAVASDVACSAGVADVQTPSFEIGLFPREAHSGFNPTASFKVMFATVGVKDAQWSVGDPSIATIAPADRPTIPNSDLSRLQFALVTTTKAGETTVTVTSSRATVTSRLIVKAYTDEQLKVGKARYETPDPAANPARPPCASCHAKPGGVDHSPLKMAGFDDATILGVIQEATYPKTSTGGQSTTSSFSPTGPLKFAEHKWNLTDPEKDGILAHLRSLPLGGATP